MSNLVKVIINTLTLFAAIFINYWTNTGAFSASTVGEISEKYDTLFAPAGYAFAIWGVIYFLLLLFAAYQWYIYFKKQDLAILGQTGWWFAIANIANGVWTLFWLNEYIGISVLIMMILLFSLIRLTHRLNLETWDAPVRIIFFVWWPLTIYFGWIIVATVANIAAFLVRTGWSGEPLSPQIWTIIMILIATGIYFWLTLTRNQREAAVVGAWAFIAIAYKQWEMNPEIVIFAIIAAGALLIAAGYQGWRNREYSPIMKLKRGEV